MRRLIIPLLFVVAIVPSARVYGQQVTAPAPTAVKIYTLHDVEVYDVVYTDRKGCTVSIDTRMNTMLIRADSANGVYQAANVDLGDNAFARAHRVQYTVDSKQYDPTKEADLITRQCGAMIRSIPDAQAKKMALNTVVD